MIPAGPYLLGETMPAGLAGTSTTGLLAGGMVYTGTANGGDNLTGLEFGNVLKGDGNGDGIVDVGDYQVWFNHYGDTSSLFSHGDFDGSGVVDVADYAIWFNNYGSTMGGLPAGGAPAPEPASLVLLAFGGLAMQRWRKK